MPDDEREYQASNFAEYFNSVLSSGLLHTNQEPGMQVKVVPGTLKTTVTPGKAIISGHLYKNTSDLTLEHPVPGSSLNRIDRVVLRLDLRPQARYIRLFVKEGTPASTPKEPPLQRDNTIFEISLAKVLIRANTSSINVGDVTDERFDERYAGFVSSLISI